MHYLLEVVLWSSIKQMGSMVKTETPQQAYHSGGEIFFRVAFLNSCTSVIPKYIFNFLIIKFSSKCNETAGGKKCKKVHTLREKIGDVQMICSTLSILELLCLSYYGSLVGQNKNIKKGKKRRHQ